MARAPQGIWPLFIAVVGMTGCTQNVMPRITPAKVPAVQPAIRSRVLLLVAPSFESFSADESKGPGDRWRYHLGEAMAAALSDLVRQSFTQGETRRVSDAEVLQWLASSPDTATTDLLLVPYFEEGAMRERLFDKVAEARVRLDGRSLRTGQTYSWRVAGRKASFFSSDQGLAGTVLEHLLQELGDTLAAHRGDLEGLW